MKFPKKNILMLAVWILTAGLWLGWFLNRKTKQQPELAVRLVRVDKADQQYRYSFTVLNRSDDPFADKLKITLVSGAGLDVLFQEFDLARPIAPGDSTTLHIDCPNGPRSETGLYGIDTFTYTVGEK